MHTSTNTRKGLATALFILLAAASQAFSNTIEIGPGTGTSWDKPFCGA